MIYFHAYFYNTPQLEISQNLKYDFFFLISLLGILWLYTNFALLGDSY